MPRFSIFNLRARLVFWVLVAVLPAPGWLVYSGWHRLDHEQREAQARALELAKAASARQDEIIESGKVLLFTLSQVPQIQQREAAACSAIFNNLLKKSKCYSGFVAYRADGEAFAAAPPQTRRVNSADRSWYRNSHVNCYITKPLPFGQFIKVVKSMRIFAST